MCVCRCFVGLTGLAPDWAFVGWVFGTVADEESEEGPEDFEDAFDLFHGNGFLMVNNAFIVVLF